jgi:hypothetical protein
MTPLSKPAEHYRIVQSPPPHLSADSNMADKATSTHFFFSPPPAPYLCRKVPTQWRLKLSQNHGNLCNLKLFHGEEIPYATEITHFQDSIYNVMLGFIQSTNKSRQV